MFLSYFLSSVDLQLESGLAAAHPDSYAGSEAVQMHTVLQGVRQLVVSFATHPHSFGHQAVPLRDMPAQVHAAVAPTAAHTHPHGR